MMPSFTIYLYVEEYYVKELRMKKRLPKPIILFYEKEVVSPEQGLEPWTHTIEIVSDSVQHNFGKTLSLSFKDVWPSNL